jgi:hypothetical protein
MPLRHQGSKEILSVYFTPEAKILKHNLCPKGRKHIARGAAPGRRNTKRTNPEGVKEKRNLLIFSEIPH